MAILIGAAIVFFLFPKKEREEELLAQYLAEDAPGEPPAPTETNALPAS